MAARKILILTILTTLALFASGCTENLSAEDIAEQMQEKEASIQDYSYTIRTTLHLGELTQESELQILEKKPNKVKTIAIEPEEDAGAISVSDGEVIWSYDPKTNTVTKIEMSDTSALGEMDYAGLIEDFLNETDVSLLGTEEIDGRSAYLLEANPKEGEKGLRLIEGMKLWVDEVTWMPLRYEMYDSNGDPVMEFEIRDLEVNQGIPDSEFVFEIPDGATVKDVDLDSVKITEQTTLEETGESVGFDILVPEYLPEGFAFKNSAAINNSRIAPEGQSFETVTLIYENEEEDAISVSETVYEAGAQDDPIMDPAEDVSINGVEGKYLTLGNINILSWKVGDVALSLTGTLKKDEILKIAESMRENA